jgi:hypothetical protein
MTVVELQGEWCVADGKSCTYEGYGTIVCQRESSIEGTKLETRGTTLVS